MFRWALAAIVLVTGLRVCGVDPFGALLQEGGARGGIPASTTEHALGPSGPAFHAQAVLLWLAATISLPLVTMSFLRSAVRQRSNGLNACVALIYVAIDLLAASAALPLDSHWATTLIWSFAAALSVAYTMVTMNLAIQLER